MIIICFVSICSQMGCDLKCSTHHQDKTLIFVNLTKQWPNWRFYFLSMLRRGMAWAVSHFSNYMRSLRNSIGQFGPSSLSNLNHLQFAYKLASSWKGRASVGRGSNLRVAVTAGSFCLYFFAISSASEKTFCQKVKSYENCNFRSQNQRIATLRRHYNIEIEIN